MIDINKAWFQGKFELKIELKNIKALKTYDDFLMYLLIREELFTYAKPTMLLHSFIVQNGDTDNPTVFLTFYGDNIDTIGWFRVTFVKGETKTWE